MNPDTMRTTPFRPVFRYTFTLTLMTLITAACTQTPETIKPTISDLTESVYASVSIQPEDLYFAYTTTSGILESVYIEEGDSVVAGQAIAKITTTNPRLNIENANLNVELARENYLGQSNQLTTITNEMEQVTEQLLLDSINYHRQKKLWRQNIGSKSTLENLELKYELGQKKLVGLKKRYRQAEIELDNQLKRSQNALKRAQSDLSDYIIKAKIDGQVYNLLKNEGELIHPQEPLAAIGKRKDFIIEMQIDEIDISKITLGQQTLISLDAYPGEVFEGRISKIYPQKENRTQTFKVEGEFTQAPKILYAGLSGEANIVYAQRSNVISIPRNYLINNELVKTTEGEQKVKLGISTMDRIEIISGIDTSTQILKP